MWGLGFWIEGVGFRVWVEGVGLRVLGFWVSRRRYGRSIFQPRVGAERASLARQIGA